MIFLNGALADAGITRRLSRYNLTVRFVHSTSSSDAPRHEPREEYQGVRALPRPSAYTPELLWPELVVEGWERVHNHAVSPDGTQVAFYWDRGGHSDLWLLDLAERGFPTRLTLNRPHVNWWEDEPPLWSPDGRWIVFGAYSDGVSNLYVIASDGGAPRQLTDMSEDAAEPFFSPDGTRIVFSTQKNDVSQIALVPFEGGWITGLTLSEDECSTPVWSPDGARIIYSASPQHGHKQDDLYSVGLDDADAERLTPDDNVECWSPAFSPDGNTIAMLCNHSSHDEVWMMARDGSHLRQLTRLNLDIEEFAWSPDGTRLIVLANRLAVDVLFVVDARSGEARRVSAPAGNYSLPQWLRGRDAVVVGFDSPSQPPALYICDLSNGALTALTRTSAAAFAHAEFVTPRHIEYASSDMMIPAFVYEPPHASRSIQRAGIVCPHGGPNVHYDLSWDPIRQYFVAKGYTVICPNYRGSTGYGRALKDANLFNWGVGDLADCLHASDYLVAKAGVDQRRVAIWGQSYGGYLTLLSLCKDPHHRFRCGVCLYGDSHLKTSWASGDHSGRLDVEWQMGDPSTQSERYESASPLNFISNIKAPLLVMHGEQDQRVAFGESVQLVDALRREGKTFEFRSYPDEAHGFAHAHNMLDALLRIERFIDWWMM